MAARKKPAQRKKEPSEETAIAKRENMELDFLTEDERQELMHDQMKGLVPTFPVAKVLHAGALAYKMPDGVNVEGFSGILLERHPANAYWKQSYQESGGGSFPDCASLDGITGKGDPGGLCSECPMNEFGSAEKGDGKACKNTERLFILEDPEDNMPFMMLCPPTSLKVLSMYLTQLGSRSVFMQTVFTKFELKEAKNKDNQEYSKLVLSIDPERELDDEQMKRVMQLRRTLLDTMRQEDLRRDQFSEHGDADDAEDDDDARDVTPKKNGGGTKGKRPARRSGGRKF